MLPSDLQCLALFFSKSPNTSWLYLNMQHCHIGNAGLDILHWSLVTNDIKIDEINLKYNSLTSASAEKIVDLVTSCKTKN